MIQFLQPIWLWAMTAIAVPLFIHLWNIRQGKTLKVGSIAFLTESTRAHSRSLRISELLLLLLRCLLLILLALLLSKPIWISQNMTSKEKGWVLLPPQRFAETYNHFKPAIDSLLDAGYTLHYFDRSFASARLSDSPVQQVTASSYWSLIQELNQQTPSSLHMHIFTDNLAEHFTGNRPPVSLDISWHTYPAPDSASYIAHAFTTPADSIRIITTHTRATGNRNTYRNISRLAAGGVQFDTAAVRICLFTDTYTTDAGYIKAALHAVRDFMQKRIQVVTVTDVKNIPANTNWLFWLSDKPLPGNLTAKNSFVYASGRMERTNTTFTTTESDEPIRVYAMINDGKRLHPVWSTGAGEILLGKEPAKNIYHFYSRFNPQWNGLTWSERFPQIIYQLIGKTDPGPGSGKLSIDEKQVSPEIVPESSLLPKEPAQQRSDLSGLLWILVFLLFLSERLFTYYSKRAAA